MPVFNARHVVWAKTKTKEASRAPSYEQTPIGLQGVLEGAEATTLARVAQKRASEPLRPTVPQLPADEGLFGDEHLQLDLVEMLQEPTND